VIDFVAWTTMMGGDSIAVDQQEDRQMIDDRTVYHLLDHIACEVMEGMRHGKTSVMVSAPFAE
jgi:hypothetical protein